MILKLDNKIYYTKEIEYRDGDIYIDGTLFNDLYKYINCCHPYISGLWYEIQFELRKKTFINLDVLIKRVENGMKASERLKNNLRAKGIIIPYFNTTAEEEYNYSIFG